MILILMGPQGSGKGTQADLLARKLHLLRVETGSLLREAAKKDSLIDEMVNKKGKLVPAELAFSLTKKYINKHAKKLENVLFDGFPRTINQYKLLKEWMDQEGVSITRVIFLSISKKETIKRLSSRRICRKCGEVYNLLTNPPPAKECKCGGALIHREDDRKEAIRKRLSWSEKESKPLIEVYKKENVFMEIDGERSIDVIHKDIMNRLKKLTIKK